MRKILVFTFLLLSQHIGAQDRIISGELRDKSNEEVIPFAHLRVLKSYKGTSSNEMGQFRLSIAMKDLVDTLLISCIGYENRKIAISAYLEKGLQEIYLTPNTRELNAIPIFARGLPNVKKLVEKAIKKIPKNYSTKAFLLEGYYRDYLLNENREYEHLLESAVGIYDPGFESADERSRIKIYQSRVSNGYPINYADHYENNLGGRSGNLNIVGGNPLSVLRYNNPIRNYARISDLETGYELNENFILHHHLEIQESTEVNGKLVLGVSVKAGERNPYLRKFRLGANAGEEYRLEGKLYIRLEDYAILKMNYQIIRNQQGKDEIINELKLEYEEYEEKLYLNYISFSNQIFIRGDLETRSFRHYRELFVNQLITQSLPSPDAYYLFSDIKDIHDQTYLNQPDFWESYNMVLQYQP